MSRRGQRFDDARSAAWIQRGRRAAIVGNAIYHTVGDREAAVRSLSIDFEQTYQDLGHAIGFLPDEGSAERVKAHNLWWTWWRAVGPSLFAAWNKFRGEQLGTDYSFAGGYIGYGNRFETDWDVYGDWRKRLMDLRAGARQMGIPLKSPAPATLPTTIAQDVKDVAKDIASKAAGAAGDVWTLGKVATYGGLGLLGAIAIGSLYSNLRSGKDPAANYLALARRR